MNPVHEPFPQMIYSLTRLQLELVVVEVPRRDGPATCERCAIAERRGILGESVEMYGCIFVRHIVVYPNPRMLALLKGD